MKAKRILNVLGYVDDQYIAEIYEEEEAETRRRSVKKVWLIAAIVAVMLVLVGCVVAYVFRLQNMKIGEDTNIKNRDNLNALIEPTEVNRTVITLHGLQGSPTFLAAQEWYTFRKNYDQLPYEERMAMDEVPEAYQAYSAYTQELIDKVDEICEKYGLKLLGPCVAIQQWESELFRELLGIESLLTKESVAKITQMSGYFYEGGNFKVEFFMEMPKEGGYWSRKMLNSLYYSKPDYFDDVYTAVENIEHCEQWEYIAKNGSQVLIVVDADGYGASVICSREDALIYMTIENYYNKNYSYETNSYGETEFMTKQQLEQVVDQFDFTLMIQEVDIEKGKQQETKEYEEYVEQIEAWENSDANPANQKDIADYIQHLIDYERTTNLYYGLYDLNGDGEYELLVGDNETSFGQVVQFVDGSAQVTTLGFFEGMYLCEGNVIESTDVLRTMDGGYMARFYQYDAQGAIFLDCVVYDPDKNPESPWYRNPPDGLGTRDWEPISEEEYNEVRNKYPRVEVKLTPISEFSFG